MAEVVVKRDSGFYVARSSVDWSAIWAGMFTFIAIWSVFGFLGFAIFTTSANPGAAPLQPIAVGMGIWAIILTAVAMFIAGRVTGRFAGLDGRVEGLSHGMIMFGLSIAAAIIVTMSGSLLFAGFPASFHGVRIVNAFGGSGWLTFVGLLLGWLSAMFGASSGATRESVAPANVHDMRPAA